MADSEVSAAFARVVPKAELHLHIEGTLDPKMAFHLAARNGLPPPDKSPEALLAKYNFADLQSFLDLYYAGCNILLTEVDFQDLCWAYFEKAAADGVKHAEIFFDPQTHTRRGISIGVVIAGLKKAMAQAEAELGVTSKLIMCFCRNFGGEVALETWEEAKPYLNDLAGIGLDSTEIGFPPALFKEVYSKAKAAGLKCCAHGGEECPPDPYVTDALDVLKVDRIDHGIRCLELPALVERLAKEKIPLTVCPVSNVKLRCVKTLAVHPLPKLLQVGVLASINSDDPAYFGAGIGDCYAECARAMNLSLGQIALIAKVSFESSFLEPADKAVHCSSVDQALIEFIGSEAAAMTAIAEAAFVFEIAVEETTAVEDMEQPGVATAAA